MGEWKEYSLGDLAEIQTGPFGSQLHQSDYVEKGTPLITVKNLGENRVTYNKLDFVSDADKERLSKFILRRGDIVFSRVGYVDRRAYISERENGWIFSGSTLRIRVKSDNKLNPKFLSYYFGAQNFKEGIKNFSVGATRPSLNTALLENLIIEIPTIEEQKFIASILSSLDDKIDLLHRQNKTLEQLAETLFRQWFVEEADESWETRKLFDIADVQNGYAFKSSDYVSFQEGFLEVLKMGHIERGGGLRSNPKRDYIPRNDKLNRWILNTNDIVMAMTDMKDNVVILGVPAMIDKDDNYVLNQRVARISLKRNSELINKYLLYVQVKDPEFIAILQSKSNSGVQVNLSIEVIKDSDIIVPPLEVQKEKGIVITNLYLKKEKNQIQIHTLTQLRDTLLPKLMSGEVRVK